MDRFQLRLIGPADPAALRRVLESIPPTLDRTSFRVATLGTISPFVASSDRRLPLDRLQTVLQIQGIETVVIDTTKQSASPRLTVFPKQVAISEEALSRPVQESPLFADLREHVWLILGIAVAVVLVVVGLLIFGRDYTTPLVTAVDESHPRVINIEAHLDGVHLTAHEPTGAGTNGGDPAALAAGGPAGDTHIHVAMGGASGPGSSPATTTPGAPITPAAAPGPKPDSAGARPEAAAGTEPTAPPAASPGRAAARARAPAAEERGPGQDTELNVKIDASGENTITVEPGAASSAPMPPPPPPLPPPEPPQPDHRGLAPACVLGLLLALTVRWVWLAWRPRKGSQRRPAWVQRVGAVSSLWALASAGAWVVITRPPDAQILNLGPAAPLTIVAGMSGNHPDESAAGASGATASGATGETQAVAGSGHRPGAFTRFFARLQTKKPADQSGKRPFHKLLKAMHTKQATDRIRASAETDWQKQLPPPGSRRTLPANAPARKWLEADVKAFWHSGAPADSHEHECVPSPLERARSSLLERAGWSYLVTESETVEAAGDAGVTAAPDVPGMTVHANVDIPAEALAAGMEQVQDAPTAPPTTGRGPRKAQTMAMPFSQQQPPEVAGLQGAPDTSEKMGKPKRRLPPLPPKQPEPPTAAERLLALLAGFAVGSLGGVFIRPRPETA